MFVMIKCLLALSNYSMAIAFSSLFSTVPQTHLMFPTFLFSLMLFPLANKCTFFVLVCFLRPNSNFLSYGKPVFCIPACGLVNIIWAHSFIHLLLLHLFLFKISYYMIFFVLLHYVLKIGTLKTRQVLKIEKCGANQDSQPNFSRKIALKKLIS